MRILLPGKSWMTCRRNSKPNKLQTEPLFDRIQAANFRMPILNKNISN
jgi:hypothetical protein